MSKRTIGTIQVALAAVIWSFSGVLCKWLPWGSLTTYGMRAAVAAVVLAIARKGRMPKFNRPNLLGAAGTMMNALLFIFSTRLTTAANAIVLQYAMPIFVIAFCWLFLKQRPTKTHLITAACILFGVVLCSWDGLSGGTMLGNGLSILSAVAFALVFFCSGMKDASSQDYTFIGNLFGVPFALFALGDVSVAAEWSQWLAILGMGLCLAGGYYFISLGMNNTSPVTAALLANLEPILNPVWVFLFLGERPGVNTLIGACIVLVAATVYSIKGKE